MMLAEYIRSLQSYEIYAFTNEDVVKHCIAPKSTLKTEFVRLSKKKQILNLRKGFYVIIPAKYLNVSKIPVQLYIEKLFNYIQKDYYVGLYSAAAIHGASHQQIQQDYIICSAPAMRDIKKGSFTMKFFQKSHWSHHNIIQKKSDAGLFNVSSPALTLADLLHFQNKLGGINRMLAIIEELAETIQLEDLNELIRWYPHVNTFQRMGYLLEQFAVNEEILETIQRHLDLQKVYPMLLSPIKNEKPGSANNRWKIDVNITLENDL
jgi:predicted transcriptional regulator of viral defense system